MKKYFIGLAGGVIGALINMVFLSFATNIEIAVYFSTAITWVAIGILISACDFKVNGILKGIIVSILVSASSLVYTVSTSFSGAIWTLVNTILVGALIGFGIEKIIRITDNKK